MSVKTEIRETQENIVDDISGVLMSEKLDDKSSEELDSNKLAELKAKMAAKKEAQVPPRIVEKKVRSIEFGVIGGGQAGSRLAECFYKLGYSAVCYNTASQDLEFIQVPEENKLLLNYSIGGAAKDLSIGEAAIEANKEEIYELVQDKLADTELLIFCTSLGGGSGSGSAQVMVDILAQIGKPVILMVVLPSSSEDGIAKQNALTTLSKLTKEVQNKKIHNLFVLDNSRLEVLLSDVGQLDFYRVANETIVKPLDIFNTFSKKGSDVKPLDSMELVKLLTDGQGLSTYGFVKVSDYMDEMALSEAIINADTGMLAAGFQLTQSKYVGFMLIAPEKVLNSIPNAAMSYARQVIAEACENPGGTFYGVYADESVGDCVHIYTMYSGLGLPESRIQQLKKEAQVAAEKMKVKDTERNLKLALDVGKDETVSAADKIKEKIAQKKAGFASFIGRNVLDKRK